MLRLLLSSVLVLLLLLHTQTDNDIAYSKSFEGCTELLNREIQNDILSSFPFLQELKKKDSSLNYTYDELIRMQVPIGKVDPHLNSLISLFHGTSMGDKTLIIISEKYSQKWDSSFTGYLFYKETTGINVVLKLKRGPEKWEVVKKSIAKGQYITLEHINKDCLREH